MLALGPNTEIFLVPGATDMRKSFDTLAALVRNELHRDPLSGQLFVFSNRRHDRLKILLYDRGGFWLLAKRLESGTFAWPQSPLPSLELSPEELMLLLGGIDLDGATERRWYRKAQ
jgi:transposase